MIALAGVHHRDMLQRLLAQSQNTVPVRPSSRMGPATMPMATPVLLLLGGDKEQIQRTVVV